MQIQECATRRADAATELEQHESCHDGARVTESLSAGLTSVRNLLYGRLHYDFEPIVGTDSVIMPVSDKRAEHLTKFEIEIYQIAVSGSQAHENKYVSNMDWYIDWLKELRLGESGSDELVGRRLAEYEDVTPADRRLHFTNVLVESLPEASHAPLVLFRLYPLSVRIATSIAFGDHFGAEEVRDRQMDILPAIADCHDCHGRPLDNGDVCKMCGNPVWTRKWLTATD